MQLERKQSNSRTLLHPGPHHCALNAELQTTIPVPFARGQPFIIVYENKELSYRGACLGYVLVRLSPRCILAGRPRGREREFNNGVQTDRQRRLADMAGRPS